MSKSEVGLRVNLFICDQIPQESFYRRLIESDFNIIPFNKSKRGWGDTESAGIFLIHEKSLFHEYLGLLDLFFASPEKRPIIVIGDKLTEEYVKSLFENRLFVYIGHPVNFDELANEIKKLPLEHVQEQKVEYQKELLRANKQIEDLYQIGMALSSEKDHNRLLELILTKSREIVGADAGSLYLIESPSNLRFKLSQNSSLNWQLNENVVIPINEKSISGQVALSKEPINLLDAYFISPCFSFTFNRSYDEKTGYRTKSVLAVPMMNQAGEIMGVIQLLNKRRDFESHRSGEPLKEANIIPFNRKDQDLLSSLASQAAIALENSKLYQEIKNLFEGFVKASVVAIESRDPTTCGHSERVALLTTAFAETITRISDGPFARINFESNDLVQIRYASLLHDFGKVGVREEILIKARKLFPFELDLLKSRFKYIRKSIEADHYHYCLDCAMRDGIEKFKILHPMLEITFQDKLKELDEILLFLIKSNEPTILEEGNFNRLLEVAKLKYTDMDNQTTEYLTERETHVLSIRKGSLSEVERIEIESHVTHTFNFLSKIPWTKKLNRIPEIAYAHHEKLNGRGYPNHLEEAGIPFESKLMTICDIYDALTAQDRPYKKALPTQKALDIMYSEVNHGLLSRELLDIFVRQELFKVIEGKTFKP
ncbi:MAG: GAF domain-containing protein [Candidatus Riflebacteria bacterium]|nr:GAF domain-containing protein [Candidatus Riflebacteria bacterium]